jgi:phospholipase/carboxylesterase
MNRLASPLEDTLPLPVIEQNFSANVDTAQPWPGSSRDAGQFATFAPMHYEHGYAYPLLVWLHGRGGNEHQLQRLMPLISMRNYVAVSPRGTVTHSGNDEAFAWSQSKSHIDRAERQVFESISVATRRFNVHNRRIFIGGYGCGGTMAVRLAWRYPDRFAGAAALGGSIPEGHRPMARINELRSMPLLLSTGREARHYDESRVCDDLRLLHSAGFTVALRQYPCGDELRTTMLSDLDRWMMEIVCGANLAKQKA